MWHFVQLHEISLQRTNGRAVSKKYMNSYTNQVLDLEKWTGRYFLTMCNSKIP